jgi:ATP/maltotriose-dependent transcriptional regulator MalT/DNA-binding SARP family transcriptional activator
VSGTQLLRQGLTTGLIQALDAGGLLLVAPAGYGKTIALNAALEQRGGAVARIRCNPGDADPGRLLRRTLTALADTAPGVADSIAAGVAAAAAPVDALAQARDLAVALERLVLDPLTIAFDDAEHLGSDSAAIVAELLAVRSDNLRVAVCSRRTLPVPLARLRAAGMVTQIESAALAFGPDDCAALLGDDRALETDAVYEATEGWPLGVAVAVASARAPRGPLRTREALFAYLAEEVFEPLEPAERDAVLASALPRELDERALDALALGPDFPRTAVARGLLMSAVDPPAFHPLFRDFLLEQLNGDQATRDLHARLGAALDGDEAVEHWLAAERWDDAAAAIEQTGTALLQVAPTTVGRWIDALPAEQRTRAGIAFLKGRLVYGSGHLQDAEPFLAAAVDAAKAAGDLQMEWVARYALADTLYLSRRYDEVTALVEGFDDGDATGAYAAPLAGIAGAAALARGACDFDGSLALFRRASAHPLGAAYAQQERAFRGFYFDFPQGRLDDALANVQYGIDLGERRGDPGHRLPFAWGFVAMIREERGEDAAALEAVARAQEAAGDKRGYIQQFAHAFRAGVYARSGRLVEAETELRGIDVVGSGFFSGDAEVTKATIALKRGDVSAAAVLAEEAVANGVLATWHERARATAHLVPVLADAGRVRRARELLDEALAVCPPECSTARLLALRAWLDERDGAQNDAIGGLAAALVEAGPATTHLLRREWPRVRTLLEATVDAGAVDPGEALAGVEAAFPGSDVLIPFTESRAAATRRAAIRALAASGNPAAAQRIAELADDPDPDVARGAKAAAERALRSPPPLVFNLFGGFTVRRGAWHAADTAWGRRAAARLVRLLLVSDAAVAEDLLLDALFADQKPPAARRGLQVAVSAARRVLDLPGAASSVIDARDHTYRLVLREATDVVDTREFERAARAALATGDPNALEAAAAAWHGDPLPEDRYEPWAIAWRERLLDLHGQLLGRLAERRAESGDAAGAIAAARQMVAIDPLAESAHRRLIAVYARAGRRADALRQFLECRRLLVDELGVEPDAETRRMHSAVLAGDPL